MAVKNDLDGMNCMHCGRTMTEYDKNLYAKRLVLKQLREPIQGDELLARLGDLLSMVRQQYPDFDFVAWAGGTIWELLGFFHDCSMISTFGSCPTDRLGWNQTTISLTNYGREFCQTISWELNPAAEPSVNFQFKEPKLWL